MPRLAALLAALFFAMLLSMSHAAIEVGDDAKLVCQTVDGKDFDLEQLRGKAVLIHFWAAWHAPSMQEAEHLAALNKKYGDSLQMLGVSLDEDQAKMQAAAKDAGFTWPQYFDGLVWKNRIWTKWGGRNLPFAVLVDPGGKVAFAGHPAAGLDEAFDRIFQKMPGAAAAPGPPDPLLALGPAELLDLALSRLDANDAPGAMKLYRRIRFDAVDSPDYSDKYKLMRGKMEVAAEVMLADIDALIRDKNYLEAAARLKDLSISLVGLPAGLRARAKLDCLHSDPQTKAAFAEQERMDRPFTHKAHAAEALAEAEDLQSQNKLELAYIQLRNVIRVFSDTDAAHTAASEMEVIARDHPEAIPKARKLDSAKAKAAMVSAAEHRRARKFNLARAEYESVIEDYPDAPEAAEAKLQLSHMQ